MKLDAPAKQYLTGPNPSHSALSSLSKHIKAWDQEEITDLLTRAGHLEDGRVTKQALRRGVADVCEGKVLWNLLETKRALIAAVKIQQQEKAAEDAARAKKLSSEPAWVDLGTIGTYFGVGNVVIGRWLDAIGLREKPRLAVNDSGAHDLLDIARQSQEKQASGFIGKQPTEKALQMGVARKITVTNRKKKEIEITQWNLDLCKAVLVKAGHELDTERKTILKGKGRNSDVKVLTADDRARELYREWKHLHNSPSTRAKSWNVFSKQPNVILVRVEALMNRPGFLTEKRYLKETF